MSSKLDILKKYGFKGNDSLKKKKPKRNKTDSTTSGLQLLDYTSNIIAVPTPSDPFGTEIEDIDDLPVIVGEIQVEDSNNIKSSKGAWSDILPISQNSSSNSQPRDSKLRNNLSMTTARRKQNSDSDASPPRKNGSHNKPSLRPPQDDSDTSPPRKTMQNVTKIQRHDSDSDASPPRKTNTVHRSVRSHSHNSDDSNSDASPPRRNPASTTATTTTTTTNENRNNIRVLSNERAIAGTESDGSPPRRRSSSSTNNNNDNYRNNRTIGRSNNTSIKSNREEGTSTTNHSSERTRTTTIIEDQLESTSTRRTKTASGHDAGLQSASSFGEKEKEMKRLRDYELTSADPHLSGQLADTTYRDKKGKKLDMLSEFMRQQAIKEGKKVKLEAAQFEWGKGSVQKQEILEKAKELAEIASQPFARTINDTSLETFRKNIIHDDDPMADYFREKIEEEEQSKLAKEEIITESTIISNTTVKMNRKPKYKGPAPPPNRFGILPGYRWDAIDRGSAFEKKLLTRSNDATSLREDEYRWAVSDM